MIVNKYMLIKQEFEVDGNKIIFENNGSMGKIIIRKEAPFIPASDLVKENEMMFVGPVRKEDESISLPLPAFRKLKNILSNTGFMFSPENK